MEESGIEHHYTDIEHGDAHDYTHTAHTRVRAHTDKLTEYAPGPGTAFLGVLNLGSLA